MTFDGLIGEIGRWHRVRWPDADTRDVVLKLVSEVGELCDAELGGELGGKGLARDEWADVMIVALAFAARSGMSEADLRAKWERSK